MEEKKYHLPESNPKEGMVMEPSPTYARTHTSVAYSSPSSASSEEWEEEESNYDADGYPLGRSLEQVMAHCEEVDKYLDDSNYGIPIEVLDAEIDKMIAEWK